MHGCDLGNCRLHHPFHLSSASSLVRSLPSQLFIRLAGPHLDQCICLSDFGKDDMVLCPGAEGDAGQGAKVDVDLRVAGHNVSLFSHLSLLACVEASTSVEAVWRSGRCCSRCRLTVSRSFLVQAFGGSIIGSNDSGSSTRIGLDVYRAGIGLQEAFILLFCVLAVNFHRRMNHVENVRATNWRPQLYVEYTVLALITVSPSAYQALSCKSLWQH